MKHYLTGFALSILLTLTAAGVIIVHEASNHETFSHEAMLGAVIALAFAQLFVQLFFFLHLGQERKPRWKLLAFATTFSIVFIVVIASLWIMNHLNYNMMPDMSAYIIHDEGIKK